MKVEEIKPDENVDNIWKLSNFADGREYDEKLDKRKTIATYFFNLSVVTFGSMVIGAVIQIGDKALDMRVLSMVIVGTLMSIAFAWTGYQILKI